jgi:MYXO-CTERM domain-containing protein
MMASKRNDERARGFARVSLLFGFLLVAVGIVASCSNASESSLLAEESLALVACGGTFSTGGSAGTCPGDTCTRFCSSRSGCFPIKDSVEPPGTGCEDVQQDRGRCGSVDANNDGTPDYTECCVDGCLDREYCREFQDQNDDRCGSAGEECKSCGECSICGSGSCLPAGGAECSGGICVGYLCCTGCISGQQCIINSPTQCGRNGGACMNCDDNRFCTLDTCSNGSCQHTNQAGPCNDGDECTVNDTCSGSSCTGSAKNCNDNNVCTSDGCNPSTGCTSTPIAGTCNDGNACTTGDSCSNGNCVGSAVNCNDGNPCTDDTCSPTTGCVHTSKAEGAVCDDGSPCSTGDRCHDDDGMAGTPRVCEPTGGPNCEDGNPCTSDTANCTVNPPTCPHGAINNGSPCSTGTLCFVGQTCQSGACAGGTAVNCDDANPCTTDACDAMTGCTHTPANQGGTCVDGNPCTSGDVCNAGVCAGTAVPCVALDECHQVGTCDDMSGTCSDPRKPDGAPCGTSGECMGGRCEGDGVVDPTGGTGGGGPGGGGPGGSNGTAGEDTGGTTNGGTSNNGGSSTGGNGTAGEGTSGTAGNGDGGTGNGNGGSGNASGTSNAGDGDEPAPLFERDPGGCACRVPAPGAGRHGYAALALALTLSFVTRRRRRAA